MKTLFLTALLVLAVSAPLSAQNQSGSEAIAESVRPGYGDANMVNFTRCVVDLKNTGTRDKDARKACAKQSERMLEASKRIANEAADATKASRPLLVYSRYGRYGSYYGGRGYYGGGYYHRRVAEGRVRQERLALEAQERVQRRAAEAEERAQRRAAEEQARQERREQEQMLREERRNGGE